MKTLEFKNKSTSLISVNDLNDILEHITYRKIFLLIDSNVYNLYNDFIKSIPNVIGYYILEAKEQNKTIVEYNKIINEMLILNITKDVVLINIGGGITNDMGGFISSTYKRGLSFINIPTTLIGQIDASIGGKNGLNFNLVKNAIGTIKQPDKIILCNKFLDTLNVKDITSGKAEMLKLALAYDNSLIEYINDLSSTNLLTFAYTKGLICTIDEECNSIRNILNFGHTIGHAIELKTDIKHGISVGIGMYLIVSNEFKPIIYKKLQSIGLNLNEYFPVLKQLDLNELLNIIHNDKKNNDFINIIDLSSIGKAYMHTISLKNLEERIKDESIW